MHQFQIGDCVVVKPGVLCPEYPTLSLAGWQGWVIAIYPEENTINLRWDSLTLRAIPSTYIRESLIEGLGWDSIVLELGEVTSATRRDRPQDSDTIYNERMAFHRWDHLADLNPGISDVLGPLGEVDESDYLSAWEEYLSEALTFPFAARRDEALTSSPVKEGTVVKVVGLADSEDRFGLLAHVHVGRSRYVLPMCELEATDPHSPNYQPLNDYVVWFANR